MKRTAICLSTVLLLSLGGVAAAQDDGNVDALLKDLEGILSDVMDDEGTGQATSDQPTGENVPAEDVAASSVAPPTRMETATTQPAPTASGAMDADALEAQLADMMSGSEGQALDSGVQVDSEPAPAKAEPATAEPEMAATDAETAPAAAEKPADAEAELATMKAGDVVMPASAADAGVTVGVEATVGERPTTVAVPVPDEDGMITMQPAIPEVPPAVAVDAAPTADLLAGQIEKLFNEGLNWFAVGEYSRAAARMVVVLQADPKHTEARYYLAYCRYKMGDFKQARAEFHALYQVKYDFTPVRHGVMAELGMGGPEVIPAVGGGPAASTNPEEAPLDLDAVSEAPAAAPPAAPQPAPKAAPQPAPAPSGDDEVLGIL